MNRSARLEQRLRVIRNFVSSWKGTPFGAQGLAIMANGDGSRPPLIWVFNAQHEFESLAVALGLDQPLIGLRSLNAVVALADKSLNDEREIAISYADELGDLVAAGPCFIGGNCQGAPIASWLAQELIRNGQTVLGFIGMEIANLPPLPLRCTMLFGGLSTEFNPFLNGIDPWPLWIRAFQAVECRFLSSAHGFYFDAPHLPALVTEISNALISQSPPALPEQLSARIGEVPNQLRVSESFTFPVVMPRLVDAKVELLLIWEHPTQFWPVYQIYRSNGEQSLLCMTVAPEVPGNWVLRIFLCRVGEGPLTWATDSAREWEVNVAPY